MGYNLIHPLHLKKNFLLQFQLYKDQIITSLINWSFHGTATIALVIWRISFAFGCLKKNFFSEYCCIFEHRCQGTATPWIGLF